MHIPQNVFIRADDLHVFGNQYQKYSIKYIEHVVDLFGDLYYQHFIKLIADGADLFGGPYYQYFIKDDCRRCGFVVWSPILSAFH